MSKPPPIPPPVPQAVLIHPQASKYLTVRCRDKSELRKFILDLETASESSSDSGGCYSAFLALADGRKLQVEIGHPTNRRTQ
jgi:hypothetical protein